MKTNRIIMILLGLTLSMQGFILYKQYTGTPSRGTAPNPVKTVASGTTIDVSGMPVRGSADAKIIFIEFSDYQCPFCATYANGVAKDLDKKFVATGRMKYVFANNPLPIHTAAQDLAIAAMCAGEQGHYWEAHDALFLTKVRDKDDIQLVKDLGLDEENFRLCVDGSGERFQRIEKEKKIAKDLGLEGTPGFAVGYFNSKGRVELKTLIIGAQPFEVFEKAINDVGSAMKS
jgi:protein-disulfide isomerase